MALESMQMVKIKTELKAQNFYIRLIYKTIMSGYTYHLGFFSKEINMTR